MNGMVKECFGKVIKDAKKMAECALCELREECIAVNWDSAYHSERCDESEKVKTDTKSTGRN